MKCLPVVLFCFVVSTARAQYIPDSVTWSAERFAGYLQQNHTGPTSQLRVLYNWIKSNIRYDKDSAMYFNWSVDHDTKIASTLRRRKGVCENFASVFADIANRLNIPSYVVHGYPSYADKNKDNSHSWVALQLNSDWYLCDPTWDAQSPTEKYYLASPEAFIATHVPFDPVWQLLERPDHYKLPAGGKINFKDSIHAFLQLDSLQQLLATERRIKNVVTPNTTVKNWESYNRMNVAIIAGERDSAYYNQAVEALNKASKNFNAFISYRNAGFVPAKNDAEIEAMLKAVKPSLEEATRQLNNMGKLAVNFQYDTEGIRHRITMLDKRVDEQMNFVSRYMATLPGERTKLFYSSF